MYSTLRLAFQRKVRKQTATKAPEINATQQEDETNSSKPLRRHSKEHHRTEPALPGASKMTEVVRTAFFVRLISEEVRMHASHAHGTQTVHSDKGKGRASLWKEEATCTSEAGFQSTSPEFKGSSVISTVADNSASYARKKKKDGANRQSSLPTAADSPCCLLALLARLSPFLSHPPSPKPVRWLRTGTLTKARQTCQAKPPPLTNPLCVLSSHRTSCTSLGQNALELRANRIQGPKPCSPCDVSFRTRSH